MMSASDSKAILRKLSKTPARQTVGAFFDDLREKVRGTDRDWTTKTPKEIQALIAEQKDPYQIRSYLLIAGAKVEKRGDLVWVILRDDENWVANKSVLQDDAFDYAQFKKDGIWDFHDHPQYGCFTFSKK